MRQLDGIRVAQLMRRDAAPDSGGDREVAKLDPCSAGGPRPSTGRTVRTATRPAASTRAVSRGFYR